MNRTKSWARDKDNYTCGTYKREKGQCTAHFIRAVVLEQLVLENLREVISFAREDTDRVRPTGHCPITCGRKCGNRPRRDGRWSSRSGASARSYGIIKRLYEDNISGKLTDERFVKMSADYEREQADLEASIGELRQTVEACEQQSVNLDSFLKLYGSTQCGQAVS